MAQHTPEQRLIDIAIPEALLSVVAAHAHDIDCGDQTTRQVLSDVATAGLADLGARSDETTLLEQAAVIEALAEQSFSTAFSLWCHRMCIEYLCIARGAYADELLPKLAAGQLVGSSAMAPGFKYAAGLGELSLRVHYAANGQPSLSGRLAWASNLFADTILFAPAYGPSTTSAPVIVALPVSSEGVQVGPELDLLALRGTASTSVTMDNVPLRQEQILTEDFDTFLGSARPVLSLLQASFCLGLATESYRQTRAQVAGLNAVFAPELEQLADKLGQVKQQFVELATALGTGDAPAAARLLGVRLEAGMLAKELTRLETMTAGSRGFITTSAVNRRYREATFIPLQAPSEAQLRAELAGIDANVTRHSQSR